MQKKQQQDSLRHAVLAFAAETWGTAPEYLWASTPDAAVLRHRENRKWYAILMRVGRERLGLSGSGQTDVLNVKCDPLMTGSLQLRPGILPAYHMNKQSWISILLDGTVPLTEIDGLLRMSYAVTMSAAAKAAVRIEPKAWLIPANPALYDIDGELASADVIRWHQSARMIVGDTVFIYVTAPVSAVRYACEVTAVNLEPTVIPGAKKEIELHCIRRFPPDLLPLETLRDYGVCGVRCARGVPDELLALIRSIAL
ncbi:MAG: MmcQ/YjbR family DNA-binding protein [Oscillospiraceae bacterium]|nr:MmcQ/YjbR family DNA-binding protein [Oscillospiraceae bacterium]